MKKGLRHYRNALEFLVPRKVRRIDLINKG